MCARGPGGFVGFVGSVGFVDARPFRDRRHRRRSHACLRGCSRLAQTAGRARRDREHARHRRSELGERGVHQRRRHRTPALCGARSQSRAAGLLRRWQVSAQRAECPVRSARVRDSEGSGRRVHLCHATRRRADAGRPGARRPRSAGHHQDDARRQDVLAIPPSRIQINSRTRRTTAGL